MGEYDNTSQANWNADAVELTVVFGLKLEVAASLDGWDLDNAYWKNRSFRRELDSLLTRKKAKLQEEFEKEHNKETTLEKGEIDTLMTSLTNEREIWIKNKSNEDAKLKFYTANENFYMHLCFIMKKHGLYFRETGDSGIAIFRR